MKETNEYYARTDQSMDGTHVRRGRKNTARSRRYGEEGPDSCTLEEQQHMPQRRCIERFTGPCRDRKQLEVDGVLHQHRVEGHLQAKLHTCSRTVETPCAGRQH